MESSMAKEICLLNQIPSLPFRTIQCCEGMTIMHHHPSFLTNNSEIRNLVNRNFIGKGEMFFGYIPSLPLRTNHPSEALTISHHYPSFLTNDREIRNLVNGKFNGENETFLYSQIPSLSGGRILCLCAPANAPKETIRRENIVCCRVDVNLQLKKERPILQAQLFRWWLFFFFSQ